MLKHRNFTILLIRHAEAQKNLEHRHGGGNQKLSAHGELQCTLLKKFITDTVKNNYKELTVYYSSDLRVINTIKKINLELPKKNVEIENFRGIDLGRLSGLSDQEIKLRYPDKYQIIKQWRSKNRIIDELDVGGESISEFYERISIEFNKAVQNLDTNFLAIFATTSTLAMISHLLENEGTLKLDQYNYPCITLAGVDYWFVSDKSKPLLKKNKCFSCN